MHIGDMCTSILKVQVLGKHELQKFAGFTVMISNVALNPAVCYITSIGGLNHPHHASFLILF